MKFEAQKKDLVKALARASGVVQPKGPLPMLSSVLLGASAPGSLDVKATDLYVSSFETVQVSAQESGEIAVNCKDLFDRVKAMPDGPISVSSDDRYRVTLKSSGSRRYDIAGAPSCDFPAVQWVGDNTSVFRIPGESLRLLAERTQYAICTDDSRGAVSAARLEWDEGKSLVRMVSTDGNRLSKMDVECSTLSGSGEILLQRKAIRAIKDFADGDVFFAHDQANAWFEQSEQVLSVRLVQGVFPPYEQVLPNRSNTPIRVSRADLLDMLKAVSVDGDGVKISASHGGRIHVETTGATAVDALTVQYEGKEVVAGFDTKYVCEALSVLSCNEVFLSLTGELDPLMIEPACADDRYVAITMPRRL